jgi:prevent-host-death family protein
MEKIGVREAKIYLSRLIEDVSKGKEIIITNHNKPVARLCPVDYGSLSLEERIMKLERDGVIAPIDQTTQKPLPPPIPISGPAAQKILREDRNG